MDCRRSQFGPFLRGVSILIVSAFLSQDLAFAAPELRPLSFDFFQKPKLKIVFPESVAVVEDAYDAKVRPSSRLIYLIQDAHANLSGQENLAKALETILRQDRLEYVFLEAGRGNSSLSYFRQFGTPQERGTLARSFLKRGELHGEEYLDLVSDHPFALWGVEDLSLYLESLKAYEFVAKNREKYQTYLAEIKSTINTLKPRIFNPVLFSFDEARTKYQKEELALVDYFQILLKEAKKQGVPLSQFPNLRLLGELKQKESEIDFKKANEEEQAAIASLPEGDQKELLEVQKENSSVLRLSSIDNPSRKGFFALLEEKLQGDRKGRPYPELSKYFAYLKLSKSLHTKHVLQELKDLEDQILGSLATTSDERLLIQSQKEIALFEKLFNLKLTPEEFEEYKALSQRFGITSLTGFLNKKIMDLKTYYERAIFLKDNYEEMVKRAEKFYQLTYDRDKKFVENMLKKLDADAAGDAEEGSHGRGGPRAEHPWETEAAGPAASRTAVLITGGFHTPNLKSLLKQRGISFVSITPQVFQETNQARYEKILLNQDFLKLGQNLGALTAKMGTSRDPALALRFAANPQDPTMNELVQSAARLGGTSNQNILTGYTTKLTLGSTSELIEQKGTGGSDPRLTLVQPSAARLSKKRNEPNWHNMPRPTPEQLAEYYHRYSEQGLRVNSQGQVTHILSFTTINPELRRWYREKINEKGSNLSVLSLGSGRGDLEAEIQAAGHRVTAVDLVPENAAYANKKGVPTIIADVHEINSLKQLNIQEPLDVIVMAEAMTHMRPEVVIPKARSWLKKDGRLIITSALPRRDNPLLNYKDSWAVLYPPGYIVKTLETNGFSVQAGTLFEFQGTKGEVFRQWFFVATPSAARLAQPEGTVPRSVSEGTVPKKAPEGAWLAGLQLAIFETINTSRGGSNEGQTLAVGTRPGSDPRLTLDQSPAARLANNQEETRLSRRNRTAIPIDVREKLEAALPALRQSMLEAGVIIGDYRKKGFRVFKKNDEDDYEYDDIVTEADLAIQRHVIAGLVERLPFGFTIIAEESRGDLQKQIDDINQKNAGSKYQVVIDPIDGTKEFADPSSRDFGTLLSLKYEDDVIAAFFMAPEYREKPKSGLLFEASELEDGVFTWNFRNGVIKNRKRLASFAVDADLSSRHVVTRFWRELEEHAAYPHKMRSITSSGMELARISRNGSDDPVAYVSEWVYIWDAEAGIYFIEKAGGIAVDDWGHYILPFRPRTLRSNRVPRIYAGHPAVVQRLVSGQKRLAAWLGFKDDEPSQESNGARLAEGATKPIAIQFGQPMDFSSDAARELYRAFPEAQRLYREASRVLFGNENDVNRLLSGERIFSDGTSKTAPFLDTNLKSFIYKHAFWISLRSQMLRNKIPVPKVFFGVSGSQLNALMAAGYFEFGETLELMAKLCNDIPQIEHEISKQPRFLRDQLLIRAVQEPFSRKDFDDFVSRHSQEEAYIVLDRLPAEIRIESRAGTGNQLRQDIRDLLERKHVRAKIKITKRKMPTPHSGIYQSLILSRISEILNRAGWKSQAEGSVVSTVSREPLLIQTRSEAIREISGLFGLIEMASTIKQMQDIGVQQVWTIGTDPITSNSLQQQKIHTLDLQVAEHIQHFTKSAARLALRPFDGAQGKPVRQAQGKPVRRAQGKRKRGGLTPSRQDGGSDPKLQEGARLAKNGRTFAERAQEILNKVDGQNLAPWPRRHVSVYSQSLRKDLAQGMVSVRALTLFSQGLTQALRAVSYRATASRSALSRRSGEVSELIRELSPRNGRSIEYELPLFGGKEDVHIEAARLAGNQNNKSSAEVHTFLMSNLPAHFRHQMHWGDEAIAFSREIAEEVERLPIQNIMIVGAGLGGILPLYLLLMGKKVYFVDADWDIAHCITTEWNILSKKWKHILLDMGKIHVIVEEIGNLRFENQGLEPRSFDMITLIDLIGGIPLGIVSEWLRTCRELLRPQAYLLIDEAKGLKNNDLLTEFPRFFPRHKLVAEKYFKGIYDRDTSLNRFYKVENIDDAPAARLANVKKFAERLIKAGATVPQIFRIVQGGGTSYEIDSLVGKLLREYGLVSNNHPNYEAVRSFLVEVSKAMTPPARGARLAEGGEKRERNFSESVYTGSGIARFRTKPEQLQQSVAQSVPSPTFYSLDNLLRVSLGMARSSDESGGQGKYDNRGEDNVQPLFHGQPRPSIINFPISYKSLANSLRWVLSSSILISLVKLVRLYGNVKDKTNLPPQSAATALPSDGARLAETDLRHYRLSLNAQQEKLVAQLVRHRWWRKKAIVVSPYFLHEIPASEGGGALTDKELRIFFRMPAGSLYRAKRRVFAVLPPGNEEKRGRYEKAWKDLLRIKDRENFLKGQAQRKEKLEEVIQKTWKEMARTFDSPKEIAQLPLERFAEMCGFKVIHDFAGPGTPTLIYISLEAYQAIGAIKSQRGYKSPEEVGPTWWFSSEFNGPGKYLFPDMIAEEKRRHRVVLNSSHIFHELLEESFTLEKVGDPSLQSLDGAHMDLAVIDEELKLAALIGQSAFKSSLRNRLIELNRLRKTGELRSNERLAYMVEREGALVKKARFDSYRRMGIARWRQAKTEVSSAARLAHIVDPNWQKVKKASEEFLNFIKSEQMQRASAERLDISQELFERFLSMVRQMKFALETFGDADHPFNKAHPRTPRYQNIDSLLDDVVNVTGDLKGFLKDVKWEILSTDILTWYINKNVLHRFHRRMFALENALTKAIRNRREKPAARLTKKGRIGFVSDRIFAESPFRSLPLKKAAGIAIVPALTGFLYTELWLGWPLWNGFVAASLSGVTTVLLSEAVWLGAALVYAKRYGKMLQAVSEKELQELKLGLRRVPGPDHRNASAARLAKENKEKTIGGNVSSALRTSRWRELLSKLQNCLRWPLSWVSNPSSGVQTTSLIKRVSQKPATKQAAPILGISQRIQMLSDLRTEFWKNLIVSYPLLPADWVRAFSVFFPFEKVIIPYLVGIQKTFNSSVAPQPSGVVDLPSAGGGQTPSSSAMGSDPKQTGGGARLAESESPQLPEEFKPNVKIGGLRLQIRHAGAEGLGRVEVVSAESVLGEAAIPFIPCKIRIGRAQRSDQPSDVLIQIKNPYFSANQAMIEIDKERSVFIRNLGKTNPTRIYLMKEGEYVIQDGHRLVVPCENSQPLGFKIPIPTSQEIAVPPVIAVGGVPVELHGLEISGQSVLPSESEGLEIQLSKNVFLGIFEKVEKGGILGRALGLGRNTIYLEVWTRSQQGRGDLEVHIDAVTGKKFSLELKPGTRIFVGERVTAMKQSRRLLAEPGDIMLDVPGEGLSEYSLFVTRDPSENKIILEKNTHDEKPVTVVSTVARQTFLRSTIEKPKGARLALRLGRFAPSLRASPFDKLRTSPFDKLRAGGEGPVTSPEQGPELVEGPHRGARLALSEPRRLASPSEAAGRVEGLADIEYRYQKLQEARRLYFEEMHDYLHFLSTRQQTPSFGKDDKPRIHILLSTHDGNAYREFARRYVHNKDAAPIIISGGIGRETPPLKAFLRSQYWPRLGEQARMELENLLGRAGVSEAELIRFILNQEGVPEFAEGKRKRMYLESTSTNTSENFEKSQSLLEELRHDWFYIGPLDLEIWTHPGHFLRAFATALKKFEPEVKTGWGIKAERSYDPAKIFDAENPHQFTHAQLRRFAEFFHGPLGGNNETRRLIEYASKAPPDVDRDFLDKYASGNPFYVPNNILNLQRKYTDYLRARKLNLLTRYPVELGNHTVTGHRSLAAHRDKIVPIARAQIAKGFLVGLDDPDAVLELRREPETENALIASIPSADRPDLAVQAAENGADILMGTQGISEEALSRIRQKRPEMLIFSELSVDGKSAYQILDEIKQRLSSSQKPDGVILKPYREKIGDQFKNVLSLDDLKVISAGLEQTNPDATIVVAGGILEAQAAAIVQLSLSNVLVAAGFNPTDYDEALRRIESYKVSVSTAARLAGFRGFDMSQINQRLHALPSDEREELFRFLDRKSHEKGLVGLTILERYLYVAVFLTSNNSIFHRLVDSSVFLNEESKKRLNALRPERQLSLVSDPVYNFSDFARVIYYQAIDSEDMPIFNQDDPIPGMTRFLLLGPYKAGDSKIGQFLAPPLGVHRIASFLKAFGFHAQVYDLDLYGEEGYLELIGKNHFDFIGFSMLEPTLKNDIRMVFETAKRSPRSFIAAGGQGGAFNAKFLIENTPVRAVVRGLGELPILDMAVHLSSGTIEQTDLARVKSIYYKNEKGEVVQSPLSKTGTTYEDLRLMSLLWDPADTPYQDYWKFVRGLYSDEHLRVMKTTRLTRTVRIYTETHCPLGCDFCSSTNQLDDAVESGTQKLHLLPADDIIRIVQRVKKAHPDLGAIYFNDDNFFLSKSRVREVADLILREHLNDDLTFFALSRVDNVDKELLQKIHAAGFYMVIFGVESFSDHVLRDMEKKVRRIEGKTQAEVSLQAVKDSLEAGLIPRINLILFYPTVTLQDLKITIDAATDLIKRGAIVDAFTYVEPYAGSTILKKGYQIEYESVDYATFDGGKTLSFPTRVLPRDPPTRDVAESAINAKSRYLEEFKARYYWNQGKLPAPVDALISFYAIYREAQRYDQSGAFATDAIEKTIGELITKESNPATLLRDDPTNTYFQPDADSKNGAISAARLAGLSDAQELTREELIDRTVGEILEVRDKKAKRFGRPVIPVIFIDGFTNSGKSFFQRELARALEARGIHVVQTEQGELPDGDWFLKSREFREKDEDEHFRSMERITNEGERYYELGRAVSEIFDPIERFNESRELSLRLDLSNLYNRADQGRITKKVTLSLTRESAFLKSGEYLGRADLRRHADLVIWLDVTPAVSFDRRWQRDPYARSRLRNRYDYVEIPSYRLHRFKSRNLADIIIDRNDFNKPKILKWPTHQSAARLAASTDEPAGQFSGLAEEPYSVSDSTRTLFLKSSAGVLDRSFVKALFNPSKYRGKIRTRIIPGLSFAYRGMAKSVSWVIKILSSFTARATTFPFEMLFGQAMTSWSSFLKKGMSPWWTFSSRRNRIDSNEKGGLEFPFFEHSRRIVQGGFDVFLCQAGVGLLNLLKRSPFVEHVEDKGKHDPSTLETRFAVTDIGGNRDVFSNQILSASQAILPPRKAYHSPERLSSSPRSAAARPHHLPGRHSATDPEGIEQAGGGARLAKDRETAQKIGTQKLILVVGGAAEAGEALVKSLKKAGFENALWIREVNEFRKRRQQEETRLIDVAVKLALPFFNREKVGEYGSFKGLVSASFVILNNVGKRLRPENIVSEIADAIEQEEKEKRPFDLADIEPPLPTPAVKKEDGRKKRKFGDFGQIVELMRQLPFEALNKTYTEAKRDDRSYPVMFVSGKKGYVELSSLCSALHNRDSSWDEGRLEALEKKNPLGRGARLAKKNNNRRSSKISPRKPLVDLESFFGLQPVVPAAQLSDVVARSKAVDEETLALESRDMAQMETADFVRLLQKLKEKDKLISVEKENLSPWQITYLVRGFKRNFRVVYHPADPKTLDTEGATLSVAALEAQKNNWVERGNRVYEFRKTGDSYSKTHFKQIARFLPQTAHLKFLDVFQRGFHEPGETKGRELTLPELDRVLSAAEARYPERAGVLQEMRRVARLPWVLFETCASKVDYSNPSDVAADDDFVVFYFVKPAAEEGRLFLARDFLVSLSFDDRGRVIETATDVAAHRVVEFLFTEIAKAVGAGFSPAEIRRLFAENAEPSGRLIKRFLARRMIHTHEEVAPLLKILEDYYLPRREAKVPFNVDLDDTWKKMMAVIHAMQSRYVRDRIQKLFEALEDPGTFELLKILADSGAFSGVVRDIVHELHTLLNDGVGYEALHSPHKRIGLYNYYYSKVAEDPSDVEARIQAIGRDFLHDYNQYGEELNKQLVEIGEEYESRFNQAALRINDRLAELARSFDQANDRDWKDLEEAMEEFRIFAEEIESQGTDFEGNLLPVFSELVPDFKEELAVMERARQDLIDKIADEAARNIARRERVLKLLNDPSYAAFRQTDPLTVNFLRFLDQNKPLTPETVTATERLAKAWLEKLKDQSSPLFRFYSAVKELAASSRIAAPARPRQSDGGPAAGGRLAEEEGKESENGVDAGKSKNTQSFLASLRPDDKKRFLRRKTEFTQLFEKYRRPSPTVDLPNGGAFLDWIYLKTGRRLEEYDLAWTPVLEQEEKSGGRKSIEFWAKEAMKRKEFQPLDLRLFGSPALLSRDRRMGRAERLARLFKLTAKMIVRGKRPWVSKSDLRERLEKSGQLLTDTTLSADLNLLRQADILQARSIGGEGKHTFFGYSFTKKGEEILKTPTKIASHMEEIAKTQAHKRLPSSAARLAPSPRRSNLGSTSSLSEQKGTGGSNEGQTPARGLVPSGASARPPSAARLAERSEDKSAEGGLAGIPAEFKKALNDKDETKLGELLENRGRAVKFYVEHRGELTVEEKKLLKEIVWQIRNEANNGREAKNPAVIVTFLAGVYNAKHETGDIAVESTVFQVDYQYEKLVIYDRNKNKLLDIDITKIHRYFSDTATGAVEVSLSLSDFRMILGQFLKKNEALKAAEQLNLEKNVQEIPLDLFHPSDPAFDGLILPILGAALENVAGRRGAEDRQRYLFTSSPDAVERLYDYLKENHPRALALVVRNESELSAEFKDASRIRWTSASNPNFSKDNQRMRYYYIEEAVPGDVFNFLGMMVDARSLSLVKLETGDAGYQTAKRAHESVTGRTFDDSTFIEGTQGKIQDKGRLLTIAVPKVARIVVDRIIQAARLAARMTLQAA